MSTAFLVKNSKNVVFRGFSTSGFDVGISVKNTDGLHVSDYSSQDKTAIILDSAANAFFENISASPFGSRSLSSMNGAAKAKEIINKELEKLPKHERDSIKSSIDDIFSCKTKNSFRDRYRKFIESASQYAGIISCVQGLLLQILKSHP